MAIVSFWSNRKEETSKTASIAAVATMTAIDNNLKSLLIETNNNDSTMEECFWSYSKIQSAIDEISKTKNVNVLESGIDALVQLLGSNKLSPEIIPNYTKLVFKNRLEVLFGGLIKTEEEYKKVSASYKNVITVANKQYDLVFVDLNKGLDEEVTKDVLKISDVIVVNISQNMRMIDDYIKFSMENPEIDSNKMILLIGRYDEQSKYNLKNIAKYVQVKQNIYAVPYNTLFFEAINEGNVPNFLLKYRKISESNDNYKFIQDIRKISSAIITKAKLS